MKKTIQILLVLNFLACTASYVKAQTFPEMITVEGGTFSMGDLRGDGGEDQLPVHNVTLKTFKMAKTETTVAQWKAFCNSTGRSMPFKRSEWIDSHPIENISYTEAVAYCDWLSKKTNAEYRLPTEAEWEYAARGGKLSKGTKYSGGVGIDPTGWFDENSGGKTHSVATKKPNELGIYDMSGNVSEWCSDWYGDYPSGAVSNPTGPASGTDRVFRGGGWNSYEEYCEVSRRSFFSPDKRSVGYGFRV
ncbi:MAG: hypothetical protein C0433_12360, partial [Cyclobacterium sp.]|nr:hypothetical protein [Cyclobacterium sp.]